MQIIVIEALKSLLVIIYKVQSCMILSLHLPFSFILGGFFWEKMEEEKSWLAFVSIRAKIPLYFSIRERMNDDCCVKKKSQFKKKNYILIKYNVKLWISYFEKYVK